MFVNRMVSGGGLTMDNMKGSLLLSLNDSITVPTTSGVGLSSQLSDPSVGPESSAQCEQLAIPLCIIPLYTGHSMHQRCDTYDTLQQALGPVGNLGEP